MQLEDPPTAILASKAVMAFDTMEAARFVELSIGHDVSIIGFDDIYLAEQACPPLTIVRQPLYHMGEVALDTLVKTLNGYKILTLKNYLQS